MAEGVAVGTAARRRGGRAVLGWLCGQAALHAGAAAFGFGCFALLFRADLLPGLTILFYRGLALLALAFCATLPVAVALAAALRPWAARRRDALGACILSLSLNLSFLVIFPVTVDRSISVFLLGRMDARPDESFTVARARAEFEAVYLDRLGQIERRMAEQTVSGNVAASGEGYAITAQGRAFVRLSRLIARVFRTDPRFVGEGAPERTARAADPR